MNASFSAHLSSKERTIIMIFLFSLIAWNFPAIGKAYAKTNGEEKSLIFEIKSKTDFTELENKNYENQLALEKQQEQFAIIGEKVSLVRGYLQQKNSPLANYTEILLAQPDWKTIIAISNSESNMGLHCYRNNCSGIFGPNGLKTYDTIPDWIVDMQNLLTQRYQGMTLNQMDGIYVQPRSYSWLAASTSVYQDLTDIESQFPIQTTQS